MKFSHGDDRAGEWNGFYGTISATDMSTSTYLKTVKITLKNKVPVPLESCNIRKKQHQRYFILPESLQADAWLVEDPPKSKAKNKEAADLGRGRETGHRRGRGRTRRKRKKAKAAERRHVLSSWTRINKLCRRASLFLLPVKYCKWKLLFFKRMLETRECLIPAQTTHFAQNTAQNYSLWPEHFSKVLIWLGSLLKVAVSIYGFLVFYLLIFRDSMLPIGWWWRQPIPPCKQARGSIKTTSDALELVHSKKIAERSPKLLTYFQDALYTAGTSTEMWFH